MVKAIPEHGDGPAACVYRCTMCDRVDTPRETRDYCDSVLCKPLSYLACEAYSYL